MSICQMNELNVYLLDGFAFVLYLIFQRHFELCVISILPIKFIKQGGQWSEVA